MKVVALRSTSAQKLVQAGGAIVAAAGLVALGLVSSVSAQAVNNSQPLSGSGFGNSDGSSDPFSSRGDQSSGVMGLIHRAMQGQTKGADEFRAEQDESLDSAAAQFRARQQELLKQNAGTSVVPVAPLPATK